MFSVDEWLTMIEQEGQKALLPHSYPTGKDRCWERDGPRQFGGVLTYVLPTDIYDRLPFGQDVGDPNRALCKVYSCDESAYRALSFALVDYLHDQRTSVGVKNEVV